MTRMTNTPRDVIERLGPSVVDQVREIRQQLDEQAGHDLHRLVENARRAADEFRRVQAAHAAAGNEPRRGIAPR